MFPQTISLIIRSFNRISALLELLAKLSQQVGTQFEIIVIDQSGDEILDRLDEFSSLSSSFSNVIIKKQTGEIILDESSHENKNQITLQIVIYPPLGGPQARNRGVFHSQGSILIFIDDDDLPIGDDWVFKHKNEHELKPDLIGLSGRQVLNPKESNPYLLSKISKRLFSHFVLSYSLLKTPYTNARYDKYIKNVEWVHGTNSSIKKAWIERVNGWDTQNRNQDEHSFAFKIKKLKKETSNNRPFFEFNPSILALRRTNIDGGMANRTFSIKREFKNQWDFISKIIYRYYPFRVILLFPFYILFILIKIFQRWISQFSLRKSSIF